ncbi:MAG: SBBP repeat-containing protein [Candidatus Erginobacter occultus]|nr:SBBP repeat-containing protein [Candidatus Erginobacter occultus]
MKRSLVLFVGILLAGAMPSMLSAQVQLDYSTYLGGSGSDEGYGITLGTDGTAYITGRTTSSNFPTANPYQEEIDGSYAAFVVALSSSGSTLIYSTYIGGSGADNGWSIALGADKTAYLVGLTTSSDFPTINPYQATFAGGLDAFVAALSSTGSTLLYSTYLGGSGSDYIFSQNAIALRSTGETYITGYTNSTNFPTENPYQPSFAGDFDAFVAGLSSSGSSLIYSTYLGGNDRDDAFGISVGADGRTYVTGKTDSTDFPTANPYQASRKTFDDAFVTAFSSSGSALFYSTYLGSGGTDVGNGIVLESDGTASITGYTTYSDFPTVNPYQAVSGGSYDVFITSLAPSGSTLTYSTYLGGSDRDRGQGLAIGTDGAISITGYTQSYDFPTVNSYQSAYGGGNDDGIVAAFSSSGSTLIYSTYLGGTQKDYGEGISLGSDGAAYVSGYTESPNFPTLNPYQTELSGGSDAFLCKLSLLVVTPSVTPTPSVTQTPTPSTTPSLTPTSTPSPTPTTAPTAPPTIPPTPSVTPTPSITPQPTTTPTAQPTVTPTLTPTPTTEPTTTPTPTAIPTAQPTGTPAAVAPPWIYDYNGDGTSDIAIFRGSSGLWAIRGISRVYFGSSTDEPVPGDYNGDGTTEIGIYRAASGLWAIQGTTRAYFGFLDRPEPGDYNGDGTTDIGIFRVSSGLWAIRGVTRVYFGGPADIPASGYYDGDSIRDIGIFRGSSGLWAIRGVSRIYFGSSSDTIVPGDYDGDGAWNYGIFRPGSGLWAIRGVTRRYYGSSLDNPVPGDYNGNAVDDIGIFRNSAGLWAIQGISRVYFGGIDDIPIVR